LDVPGWRNGIHPFKFTRSFLVGFVFLVVKRPGGGGGGPSAEFHFILGRAPHGGIGMPFACHAGGGLGVGKKKKKKLG